MPLQVTLRVTQPSVVELTVGETVQLDRLRASRLGRIIERHRLVPPGATTLALEQGVYAFRTLSDSQLRVIEGGVDTGTTKQNKDDPPRADPDDPTAPLPLKGDPPSGEPPRFTVR